MRLFTALSLAFLLSGCGLVERLQNNVILVATLLQSPQPPTGIGGAQVVVAQLYLAQKSGDLTSPPSEQSLSPITGATVAVLDNGGSPVTLNGVPGAPGYYESTSLANPSLIYTAAHTYRFTATVGSEQYWAEIASVPAAPAISVQNLSGKVATYPSYGSVTDPYPISRTGTDIAFYGVWTVSGTTFNPNANPTCTNLPQTAGDLLTLIFVNDAPYRVATFDVSKGTCFPNPPGVGNYVVGLTAVKRNTATSSNLAIYSAALAGTSDAVLASITGP